MDICCGGRFYWKWPNRDILVFLEEGRSLFKYLGNAPPCVLTTSLGMSPIDFCWAEFFLSLNVIVTFWRNLTSKWYVAGTEKLNLLIVIAIACRRSWIYSPFTFQYNCRNVDHVENFIWTFLHKNKKRNSYLGKLLLTLTIDCVDPCCETDVLDIWLKKGSGSTPHVWGKITSNSPKYALLLNRSYKKKKFRIHWINFEAVYPTNRQKFVNYWKYELWKFKTAKKYIF